MSRIKRIIEEVAEKLNKPFNEVTDEDIKNYIDEKDKDQK